MARVRPSPELDDGFTDAADKPVTDAADKPVTRLRLCKAKTEGELRDVSRGPSDALRSFGSLRFPTSRRKTCKFAVVDFDGHASQSKRGSDGGTAQAGAPASVSGKLEQDACSLAEGLVGRLLTGDDSLWRLSEPSVLISVHGDDKVVPEGVASRLSEGLTSAAIASSAWVTTSAIASPVNSLVGVSLAAAPEGVTVIGIAPQPAIDGAGDILNIPKGYQDLYTHASHHQESASGDLIGGPLEMHHTHMLIVHTGDDHDDLAKAWRLCDELRRQIEEALCPDNNAPETWYKIAVPVRSRRGGTRRSPACANEWPARTPRALSASSCADYQRVAPTTSVVLS